MATAKRTRLFGASRPKPHKAPVSTHKFPHTDMPRLPGYEDVTCGGRHGNITYADTFGSGGKRYCKYCAEHVPGVLAPKKERAVERLLGQINAAGRASNAAARAKTERRSKSRTGGQWTLRRANVGRDKHSGRFTTRTPK